MDDEMIARDIMLDSRWRLLEYPWSSYLVKNLGSTGQTNPNSLTHIELCELTTEKSKWKIV